MKERMEVRNSTASENEVDMLIQCIDGFSSSCTSSKSIVEK
jgi:hypothetical protein